MSNTDQQAQQDLTTLYELYAMDEATEPAAAQPIPPAGAAAPVGLQGMQRQGDLLVIPRHEAGTPPVVGGYQPISGDPVTILATEHAHQLTGTGSVHWAPANDDSADLGMLIVSTGSTAVMSHTDNHGALLIGPGNYVIRRQRVYLASLRPRPELPSPAQRHQDADPFVSAPEPAPARALNQSGWRLVWD